MNSIKCHLINRIENNIYLRLIGITFYFYKHTCSKSFSIFHHHINLVWAITFFFSLSSYFIRKINTFIHTISVGTLAVNKSSSAKQKQNNTHQLHQINDIFRFYDVVMSHFSLDIAWLTRNLLFVSCICVRVYFLFYSKKQNKNELYTEQRKGQTENRLCRKETLTKKTTQQQQQQQPCTN